MKSTHSGECEDDWWVYGCKEMCQGTVYCSELSSFCGSGITEECFQVRWSHVWIYCSVLILFLLKKCVFCSSSSSCISVCIPVGSCGSENELKMSVVCVCADLIVWNNLMCSQRGVSEVELTQPQFQPQIGCLNTPLKTGYILFCPHSDLLHAWLSSPLHTHSLQPPPTKNTPLYDAGHLTFTALLHIKSPRITLTKPNWDLSPELVITPHSPLLHDNYLLIANVHIVPV